MELVCLATHKSTANWHLTLDSCVYPLTMIVYARQPSAAAESGDEKLREEKIFKVNSNLHIHPKKTLDQSVLWRVCAHQTDPIVK